MRHNRKGQVNTMGPAIIALVIAAVFLILGVVMLQELRDTDVITKASTRTVVNETLSSVNHIPVTVAEAGQPGFNSFEPLQVTLALNGTLIPLSNVSSFSNNGTLFYSLGQGNVDGFNNTDWNVTYSFNHGDEAFTGSNLSLIGMGTFADFWEIIVLAIVISIVIGLLLIAFGRQSVGGR